MDESVARSLESEFQLPWPLQPNTTATNGVSVLWTGPREWVILDLPFVAVRERVQRACGAWLHHVTDMTDGRAAFELSGPLARDVIAKGCSLDLHPRTFKAGACAQTLLADVAVLLYYPRTAPESYSTLRLYTDASVSDHARNWLRDAALEFDTARGQPVIR